MGTVSGNTRDDAKNELGLSGASPVDPSLGEVLPRGEDASRGMDILVPAGTIVKATHPGRVLSVVNFGKGKGVFIVRLTSFQPGGEAPLSANQFAEPGTGYGPLGTVDVVEGQLIGVGDQLGTTATTSASGKTLTESKLVYKVYGNTSGTPASEVAPESDLGISLVKKAQVDGIAPIQDTQLREPPPEASDDANQLAPVDEKKGAISELPTEGPRVSNAAQVKTPADEVVHFREQINQVYTHDFLVFIDGVDVTKYVVGGLEISIVDKDGWNEASLSLNNAANNFVITYENLGIGQTDGIPKFRVGDIPGEDKYSERAKKEIIDYKTDEKRNPFVDIEAMALIEAGSSQGIVAGKNFTGFAEDSVGNETTDIAPNSLQELGQKSVGGKKTAPNTDRRWQLGYMSTVFHKNDPIRIFRKNPIREADEWMPAFTGYLENISYDTNYVTGVSNVKLTCYDIRAMISKMRVQTTAVTAVTNPKAIFRGRPDSGVDSLFSDLLDPSIKFHPLSGRRYEDVMEFLITGTATQDKKLETQFRDSGFSRGVGDFTVGERIFHKPGDENTGEQPDGLEHWHSLCLFGYDGQTRIQGEKTVKSGNGSPREQFTSGSKSLLGPEFNRRWLTQAEARKIGSETTHDGAWAPHAMFLHLLLPAEGTGARNLLDFDAFNASGNQLEFRGKLDILQDFSNRIDYQFWVTPMGDIVVEFPQYDFYPRDYGEYEHVFRVDKHLQSDNIQDEAGEMTTAVIANGRISPASEANIEEQFQPKAVVVAPLMMIRYGVLEHELALPFISDALSLKRLAQIAFQKKLAESNRMDMQFDYRPFIMPNRPMENFERQRMALTTSVSNRIEVFGSASTSISSRYVRRALAVQDGNGGLAVKYTLITGGSSMPITYRQIYKIGTQGALSSGGRSSDTGVGLGKTDQTGGTDSGANPSTTNPGTGLSTTKPLLTPGNQTAVAAINECVFAEFGFTPEMAGRFKAAGQMLSGFTETARHTNTDGFGMFMMKSDVRGDNLVEGAFGIGDSTDMTDQIGASADYFSGLVGKYKGNLDDAMAEFSLGATAIKNIDIRAEWDAGWGAVNKELGKSWESLSQSLQDGWDVLFPGQVAPVDTETVASSDEAKAEQAAAEEAGAIPEDPGYQSSVGVLTFDNDFEKEALKELKSSDTVTQAAIEEQVRQLAESRGRSTGVAPPAGPALADQGLRDAFPDATDEELGIGDFSPNVVIIQPGSNIDPDTLRTIR